MMRPNWCGRRRGYAMLEIIGGVIVLGMALAVTVRLIGWVAAERRAAERRSWATVEAANVMERLAGRPWDDLTAGSVATEALGPAARDLLPGGRLGVLVTEADGLKRITIEVRWHGRSGADETPVRLTAWVGPRMEARR
jgi:hypothetical protein